MLLLFQNFAPTQAVIPILLEPNAKSYVITNRAQIDALKAANVPYVENNAGIFELPVLPNIKTGSPLKNPHRYNKCKDLYTPAANARMRTQFFNVQTFGAIGGSTPSPFAKYASSRSAFQIQAHDNLVKKMFKSPRLLPTDEMDWIGIQSAIVAAHLAGGGTVLIPDTGKNYLITRPIWLYSNVRYIWLTNPNLKTHSYVELYKPSGPIGTTLGSYNPYVNDSAYEKITLENASEHFTKIPTQEQLDSENLHRRTAVGFVCKSYFYEPRVIALTGENAISFAKGSYDIQIYGGIVRGARFGTAEDVKKGFSPQGGKGIQLESGVQQAIVDGLTVLDSSIGLSASAGLYLTVRDNPVRYANAADKITFRNITMKRVDLPFLLSHLAFTRYDAQAKSLAPQSVLIENFDFSESGRLSFKHQNAYTNQSYILQGGIFGFLGGSNITVRNTKGKMNQIANLNMIGALVRGYGRNIDIRDIDYRGTISSLVDLHTPLQNAASAPWIENFRLSHVQHDGRFGYLFRVPSPIISRIVNGKPTEYYAKKFQKVVLTDIRSSGGPANAYFSPEGKYLKKSEIKSPNLKYKITIK